MRAGYLAPEQAAGRPATPGADLYALGIVAYQCLTGRVPFHGEPLAVALAHRAQPLPPLPPSIPADVAALLADLTAKDPSARPASAGEVAERAEHVRAVLAAPDAARHRRQGRPIARLPARAALVLGAIIAVAAASWVVTGVRGAVPGHPRPAPSATVQQPNPQGRHPAGRAAPADRTGGAARAHGRGHRSAAPRKPSGPGAISAPSGTATPTGTATPAGKPAPSASPSLAGGP